MTTETLVTRRIVKRGNSKCKRPEARKDFVPLRDRKTGMVAGIESKGAHRTR